MKMNKSLAADLQNIILAKYIIHVVVMYYCLVYIYICYKCSRMYCLFTGAFMVV